MPVSRNRKRKNNQNNNSKPKAALTKCIHELFNLQINNCRKCGSARDKFEFNELPKEEKLHWDKAGVSKSIDFILYCPSCEEYSAILDVEGL